MEYKIKIKTLNIDFRPYAMAKMSNDIFKSAINHTDGIPVFYLFMYCLSIELGLKSIIFSKNSSKKLGCKHDLEKLSEEFKKINPKLLSIHDEKVLQKINKFYKGKSLEYFDNENIIEEYAHGLKNFPNISKIKKIASKINIFLKENNFLNQ